MRTIRFSLNSRGRAYGGNGSPGRLPMYSRKDLGRMNPRGFITERCAKTSQKREGVVAELTRFNSLDTASLREIEHRKLREGCSAPTGTRITTSLKCVQAWQDSGVCPAASRNHSALRRCEGWVSLRGLSSAKPPRRRF